MGNEEANLGACNGGIEIVELEPEEHAVPVWSDAWISEATMVMFHVPSVQLKDQPVARDQPLILSAAVRTFTAKETLIPATALFDVAHADERLWTHSNSEIDWANHS